MRLFALALTLIAVAQPALADHPRQTTPGAFAAMVARHAQANGLPESLVHRVIARESRYNPAVVSRGNYGLMQIRIETARAMGYRGSAAGLLDAETNMTYAVKYLAGAYRKAGGNHDGAVANYARGYHAGGSSTHASRAHASRTPATPRGYAAYTLLRPVTAAASRPRVARGSGQVVARVEPASADRYAWASPERRHQIY